jgi:hypothetical protein
MRKPKQAGQRKINNDGEDGSFGDVLRKIVEMLGLRSGGSDTTIPIVDQQEFEAR